jgi:hypothetical protein
MHTAELPALVADNTGAARTKQVIEQCLNKRLTLTLLHQLKRPLAMCSNDAKSCHDRIIHLCGKSCMRRMGNLR